MVRESYPFIYRRPYPGQYALLALLLWSISGCGNDLSDLNTLSGPSVEMVALLSADQVVSPVPVTSDSEGEAWLVVNLGNNTIAGQVSIQQQGSAAVEQVQLRRGFGGRNGAVVLDLSPDAVDPSIWHLPDNSVLGNADMELLLRSGMHVLVTTTSHRNGELRGQLLQWDQELLVNRLGSDQLVDFNETDNSVSAMSYLSVDFFTGEVQGNIRLLTDVSPTQVSMHVGLAGTEGEEILRYEPDGADSRIWSMPANTVLDSETLQRLEDAQLYVQAMSANYPQGAIRGQLYLPYYVVRVTGLSGQNLAPQVSSPASGKAFVTINAYDGVAQAIVRVSGISPDNVILFRANNANRTERGRLLFTLESQGDYWQLPLGTEFTDEEFNDIGKGRLFFIASSPTYPMGEIGGML
jgi:hypothetical protein